MCGGTTYLLAKSSDIKDPENYRPTNCLSTIYKLITSVLTDRTYLHLEQNDLFPLEQKGCRRYLIFENRKNWKRNLSCVCINYRKTFDSVPVECILRRNCLNNLPK